MRRVPTRQGVHFPQDFSLGKVHEEAGDIHHAGGLVHHNETAGSHHGTSFGQCFVVELQVQVLLGETSTHRTTGLHGFEFVVVFDPAGTSKIISRSVIPIGTSIRPGLTTFPPTAKVFVPLDFSVPMLAYQAAPFKIICGTTEYVSTLLLLLGLSHTPLTEGKGDVDAVRRACP